MSELAAIFDCRQDFDADGDFEAFLKQVPARWVVYLFADRDDNPVQLLCVKNLRASLKRRLGGQEALEPTRRVNYRDVVRRVYWHRVDSALEADWIYLEAARRVFPKNYQAMIGFRPAWFVHINPDAPFPRYLKTTDFGKKNGTFFGPLEDKSSATRLIELLEDTFDLCRYYNILTQAPQGKACAYKEMGKCPAPCDGSIPMTQYRLMIAQSLQTLLSPQDFIDDQTRQMRQAASELRFEAAGRIKAKTDAIGQLGKGSFRHARKLADFAFLALRPGPRAGTAKAFLATPGRIEELVGLIAEPATPDELLHLARSMADQHRDACVDEIGAQRIGLVSHHLFSPRQTPGSFLPLSGADAQAVVRAYRELQKQPEPETEPEAEGIVKELHAQG